MSEELFREFKGVEGRMMLATRDTQGNAHYQIWFDYTRNLMNQIREGDLVAVPNFSPSEEGMVYSVLSLTDVMPIHYALGKSEDDLKGYPGHVMEAAKNIARDWRDQENEPTEDVTKIVCYAVSTFLEIIDSPKLKLTQKPVREETAMPMPGEETRLLSQGMVNRIINRGIDPTAEDVISVGSLLRDEEIKVLMKVEDFLKLHFGIFGFTGVGKSNLLSTVIDTVLSSKERTKIFLFDVMDEYKGILFDQFLRKDVVSQLIVLDVESLPGPVFDYINGDYKPTLEDAAVESFSKTLLLPKSLKSKALLDAVRKTAPDVMKKVRIILESRTAGELRDDLLPEVSKGNISPANKNQVENALTTIFNPVEDDVMTPELAQQLLDQHLPNGVGGVYPSLTSGTARDRVEIVKRELERIANSGGVAPNEKIVTTADALLRDANDSKKSSMYTVTAFRHEAVLGFCSSLAWKLYASRRALGRIDPLVSFIADEGDLFIPGSAERESETARVKAAMEMIARRGRKFGMGIGIATQRAAYLDTKTMGQLHTYFVSKLPRSYDREAVSNAFGLSDAQFAPTFKFRSGEWLLVSHDATGLKGVPIPIRARNAEDRIRANLGVG